MRVSTLFAVLAAGLLAAAVVADEPKGRYTPVASGKPPQRGSVKVYTNADLAKMFPVVAEEDREKPATETKTAEGTPAETDTPAAPDAPAEPDPLTWLNQRQQAQREHQVAIERAQSALTTARSNLANLERQAMAARNPYSARPQLPDEEIEKRRQGGETAAQRNERTQGLVEKAREAVRAAEAEIARLQTQRP